MKYALAIAVIVCGFLTGCSAVKNLTGQNDNTVLPGNRENILPPEQQTARDPIVTGDGSGEQTAGPGQAVPDITSSDVPCDPNAPDCVPPIDQEASAPVEQ
jgi:hypothetical protein